MDEDERAEVLAKLRERGYLDDARVAVERAGRLAARGYGDAAIQADLAAKGVGDETIESALATLAPEAERAAQAAEALGGGARAVRALARKGFGEAALEAVVACEGDGGLG